MGRTLRGKKLRSILYRVADGKCQICGCELPADWHCDHVIPHVVTGETNYLDMQALCPKCNLVKGSSVAIELRDWQSKAWKKCQQADKDFFVEATPGAGKTTFGCYVAERKLDRGIAARLIVVVPTTTLKDQWAEDLHRFKIDAEPRYSGGRWPKDFGAICVTYHQVANDPGLFRYHVAEKATIIILDEVHHCGDDANWGQAINHAFELAVFRLALSGTPFRSDKDRIPFLKYIDGKAKPDEVYGYGDGLRDRICRHVFFPRQGGTMEWSSPQGSIKRHTFDDALQEAEASQRLRTALTTGEWMTQTLLDANSKLMELRQDDPDAAGLVIAIDQNHAKKIQRTIASKLGIEATCVLSDDPFSHDKLDAFRESNSPWVVAVKMVSEGVDIPRLRVGVYATTVKTEMFFRQAVGRFVRVEKDHDDPTAMVYIPDDPTLRAYAEEIRQQRIHELQIELEDERRREKTDAELQGHDASLFMPLASEAESKGTIFDEFTFSVEELERAGALSMGQCRPEVAAAILRRAGMATDPRASAVTESPSRKRLSDVRKSLRELNRKLVCGIAYATGREHAHINRELNDIVGIRKIADASVEQLERRLIAAEKLATNAGAKR